MNDLKRFFLDINAQKSLIIKKRKEKQRRKFTLEDYCNIFFFFYIIIKDIMYIIFHIQISLLNVGNKYKKLKCIQHIYFIVYK